MFPLHFHYEDVLRQDLLLKLNHANVMEVPGLFEIRLVPKAASDFRIPFSKLAMEILCGQRFIQTQSYFKAGKSFRSNPFLGSEKDTGYVSDFARQSVLRGHGMYHFFFIILTVMSMLDSPVEIRENSIKFFMETEFCEFSPELEISRSSSIFEGSMLLLSLRPIQKMRLDFRSGFLLKDEGETK
uniref:ribosomal protein L5 n=1 Tax=Poa pratensis TaxID=4545 RepID=UPI00279FC892|nr:ribosomal protein L5 [Poa pratensis]WDZ67872.1 ribosomal protein L5 [Poa pratensis]WFQ83087.1 ribosomal protein L5 [Poa pratensis]